LADRTPLSGLPIVIALAEGLADPHSDADLDFFLSSFVITASPSTNRSNGEM
jgi:hypothetical protein